MAQQTARPISDTDGSLAIHGKSLPPEVEAELRALEVLNDDVLWAVARSRINTPKQRRWRRLLEKSTERGLTEPEQQELARLVADSDRLAVCKAQAYLLLKQRGHRIPELDKLRTPA
jgi:hypothetical protein